MYGVRYTVLGKNEHAVIDEGEKGSNAACFYQYNCTKFHNKRHEWGTHIVKCYVDKQIKECERGYDSDGEVVKKQLPEYPFHLTSEQIQHHLNNLKDVFPTHFIEEEDQYVIELREAEYICHTQIRAALDFIRLLWEDGILETVPEYFKYAENHELKVSYFVALQAIFIWLRVFNRFVGIGHSLPCTSYYDDGYGTIITEDEFFNALKTNTPETQTDGSFGLWKWIAKKRSGKEGKESGNKARIYLCLSNSADMQRKVILNKLKAIDLLADRNSIEKIIEAIKNEK